MTQAFARRIQVQRHIGTASLEHGEQRHGHVQRTTQRHADQHVRADTQLAQLPGQTVTALVQFGVAQAWRLTFAGKDQRRCIGRALYLRFEQTVCGGVAVGVGSTVHCQQLLTFVGREHRQLGDGLQRVGTDRGQQVAPVPGQASDGRLVKNVGGVGEGSMQLFAFTAGGKHQVAGGRVRALRQCLLFGRQIGHAQAAAQLLVEQVGHHRLVIEHHLIQRVMALTALRLQGVDDGVEWQLLMRLGTGRGVADDIQQIDEAGLRRHFTTQYLSIDEAADQPFGFAAGAVGDQAADTDVGLPAVAMQQAFEGRQQHHEQGHALALREAFQVAQQLGLQCQLQASAVVTGQGRIRTVGG